MPLALRITCTFGFEGKEGFTAGTIEFGRPLVTKQVMLDDDIVLESIPDEFLPTLR
jgi:hypothetical protein